MILELQMDISEYSSWFHDGSVIDITNLDDRIDISLESAELSPEDVEHQLPLSSHGTIKGILHLEGLNEVKNNGTIVLEKTSKSRDWGEILCLRIEKNNVKLLVRWVDLFSASDSSEEVSNLEFEAEKIWWENIPDLYDPFW